MKFYDYSPVAVPSMDQQRDALQKGLGRAMQWARSGSLAAEPLLEACLRDQRYDTQCEDNRGDWLWELINAIGVASHFRQPIYDRLAMITTEDDAHQLCQLALHYARAGDGQFEAQLYDFVERRPIADSPSTGEGQLLEIGGELALQFIARIRGRLLEERAWEWDDDAIVDRAIEKFGEQRVTAIFNSSNDPAIQRFAARWPRAPDPVAGSARQSRGDELRSIPVSDILDAAYRKSSAFGWYRGWGMHAEDADLETVLHVLRTAQHPDLIINLLKVFSNRALPRFDPCLIDLCRHHNEEVQRRAYGALEMNSHSLVRQYALDALQNPETARLVVGLFIRNFEKGDEDRLLESVELPRDDWQRHSLLMDVAEMLEENHGSDSTQLGIIVYAETPCQICRSRAVRLMVDRRVAPRWLLEEYQDDATQDCREFGLRVE